MNGGCFVCVWKQYNLNYIQLKKNVNTLYDKAF